MDRRERYFWAAVCISLLLHVAVLAVAAETGKYARVWLPPLRRPEDTVLVSLQKPPVIHDDMGDRAGVGTASSSSEGPKPLTARQADQDQPLLSREPTGPGKIGKAPPANLPPGERGHGGQTGQMTVQVPPKQSPPAEPALARAQQPSPPKTPPPAVELPKKQENQPNALLISPQSQKPPTTAPAVQVAAAPQMETKPAPANQASKPQTATGDGLAPGRATSADPAQQSDSESDAFTTVGSAVFHDGRLRVRSGRKIKTVRPVLLVPGILDSIGVSDPSVVLKVSIDPTGKVTLVDVLHSSGSNDIDQPCVVAMYDWWFEPARDARGNPVSDIVLFTISFR